MSQVPLRWSTRTTGEPIAPEGMLAPATVVRPLLDRLLREDDEALARLRMVASPRVAVVLGDAKDLPWIDGVIYLRRASQVFVPSWLELELDVDVAIEALRRRAPDLALPATWIPEPGWLVSVADARPPQREVLREHREAWS
ncbi:MAG: hypothetical protein AAF799_16620 [Myxococcota bacterium]